MPKAEPFKQWLAQVGYERVQEIENPELAQKCMKEIYKAKGYSDDWIEKRVRGIAIRDKSTAFRIILQKGIENDKKEKAMRALCERQTFS